MALPVFLPGESNGRRSLAGYCPLGGKESDMTKVTQHACMPGSFSLHLWASLVAQTVKILCAKQESQVQSLGQEDLLEKGRLPTPVFLPGEFQGQRSLVGCSPWGCKELDLINTSTLSEKWLHKMKYKILYYGFLKLHRKKYGMQKHLILLYPFHSFGSISVAEFKYPIIPNYMCIH